MEFSVVSRKAAMLVKNVFADTIIFMTTLAVSCRVRMESEAVEALHSLFPGRARLGGSAESKIQAFAI